MTNRQERQEQQRLFTQARRAESQYNNQLRRLARQVGQMIKDLSPAADYSWALRAQRLLNQYADALEPWAQAVATKMLADVSQRDLKMWRQRSLRLSKGIREELISAPTGQTFEELMRLQVGLIKSIPKDAAQRVHDIATGTLYSGARPDRLMQEILRTTEVSEARARLIARTETARASATFMQARAEHVGSEGYIWRCALDFKERDSHREMEGKYVRWSTPPTLDGLTGHAGCLPNCRCWAEPVLPEIEDIR